MSGGTFDYTQYHIKNIAESIESELIKQGKEKPKEDLYHNEDWYKKYPEDRFEHVYRKDIQKEFKKAIKILKQAYIYAQRIDWYLAGDDAEDSFIKRLNEELEDLKNNKHE